MEQYLSNLMSVNRFNTGLIGLLALVAMLLATVGIYGVISYSVNQRTHEFGLRLALGASRSNILCMVLRHAFLLAVVGVGIGLAGAYGLNRYFANLLFEITPTDPFTFALVSIVLVGVVLVTSLIPARRATKVDPMVALRYE